jgi:hypothetical protein
MNKNISDPLEISGIYFGLSSLLRKLKKWQGALIIVLSGIFIFGVGFLSANFGENDNFLKDGFNALGKCIHCYSFNTKDRYNVLAFLYIAVTIYFFISNLFVLPWLIKKGQNTINRIGQVYAKEREKSFPQKIFYEMKHLKHSTFFIVAMGIVFFLGEITVIWNQAHQIETKHWSIFFISYLLILPVSMNAIMVGTQSSLIRLIIRIIGKMMPPLPAKLFDDDGYAGLAPAGTFICVSSLIWLMAILFLTPLFYLSEKAGAVMFIALGLIGIILFTVPLYLLHKKLLDRKRDVMKKYATILNKAFSEYEKKSDCVKIEQINMFLECYKKAGSLKVWVLFSMPSMAMQILSVIWTLINKDVIEKFKEVIHL